MEGMPHQPCNETTAAQRWRAMVEAEHAQSERARGGAPSPEDHWQFFASFFRQDPRRADDPLVERLAQELTPQDTLLDVGAGGGRLALPLALRCRHVTAVEPSPSMIAAMQEEAAQAKIRNVTIVQAAWEEAPVHPAHVVLCAHVLYTVRDIETFLRKMDALAMRTVLVLVYTTPPQHHLAPLWQRVHGQARLRLPALKDLLEVLWEMGIYPDVEMLPPHPRRLFEDWEEAREGLGRRLFIAPDSPQERTLDEAMRDLFEQTPEGLGVRGASLMRPALVSWRHHDSR